MGVGEPSGPRAVSQRPRGARPHLHRLLRLVASVEALVERDLRDRVGQLCVGLACGAERPAGRAGERVALPEGVEHLAADPACRVGDEGSAVVAVPLRGLYETQYSPGDEVLAVRAAAARVHGAGGHGAGEVEVGDDALVGAGALLGPGPASAFHGLRKESTCALVCRSTVDVLVHMAAR